MGLKFGCEDNLRVHWQKHIHSNVFCEWIKYPCGLCSKFFSRKQNIGRHQRTVHKGVRYLCIQGDKQFYSKDDFCEHQREACGQCLEQCSQNRNLGKHQRQVYVGVKCKCNYQATTNKNLAEHYRGVHEGVKYL